MQCSAVMALASGEPHIDAIGQNALNGAMITGRRQFFSELVILSTLRKCNICCAFLMIAVVLMLQVRSSSI